MIEITYPGNLRFFYKILVDYSELDFFNGPAIYESTFEFRETRPFSENFDSFGAGDMNLFFNTGSAVIILLIIIVWFVGFALVYRCTRGCAHIWIIRRISMFAHGEAALIYPLIKLFYEGQIEFTMAALMGALAIFGGVDGYISSFFTTRDDTLCSVLTLMFLGVMLA